VFALLDAEHPKRDTSFDLSGAVFVTSAMLLSIYSLVRAPDVGFGSPRTIGELATAAVLFVAFVFNERRAKHPLVPFSIFRIKGLAAANLTQLISFSGLYSMFFFLSLYMQNVLRYSPVHTGLAYLPVTGGFIVSVAVVTQLLPRIGTRPVIVGGAVLAAAGIYLLSHVPVHGSFVSDLLPGIVIVAFGLGGVFTGVTTAATEGVPAERAGIASGLLNASMQFGGALGLAVLSAVATDRTRGVLDGGAALPAALTSGFQRAFLLGTGFVAVAATIALLAGNIRAGQRPSEVEVR
jgi:predicted MFS family arabinose efflux permease